MVKREKVCWQCGKKAAVAAHGSCKECHATYERTNRGKRQRKKLEQAFLAGFGSLKADLLDAFRRIGSGEMNGYTAVEIVKNSKPDVPRDTTT